MTPEPRVCREGREITLVSELARMTALFQARTIATVMGIPAPTDLNAATTGTTASLARHKPTQPQTYDLTERSERVGGMQHEDGDKRD